MYNERTMTIMLISFYIIIAILGLIFGSFAGATVWRLRARQLASDQVDLVELAAKHKSKQTLTPDESEGLAYLKASKQERLIELKRLGDLATQPVNSDRSRCLECGHVLKWNDLLPLVSWLSTKGNCRYCKRTIGRFEPLMEIGMATAFVLFFHFWLSVNGLELIGLLVVWLVIIVMLGILFAYDLKWFLLPDAVMFPLIGLSAVYAVYMLFMSGDQLVPLLVSTLASVVVLAGLYLGLWLVSKGQWVGFGDVKLGLAMGLLLMNWQLALLTLFLANLIGTLVVLPGMLSGKMSRKTQIPFGPLLIIGFFISLVYGQMILDGYSQFSLWLSSAMLML